MHRGPAIQAPVPLICLLSSQSTCTRPQLAPSVPQGDAQDNGQHGKSFLQCPRPQQHRYRADGRHSCTVSLQCHLKRSREEGIQNPRKHILGEWEEVEWPDGALWACTLTAWFRSSPQMCLDGLAVSTDFCTCTEWALRQHYIIPPRRHLFPTWGLLKTSSYSWIP